MRLAHTGRKAAHVGRGNTPGAVPGAEGGWKKVVAPTSWLRRSLPDATAPDE